MTSMTNRAVIVFLLLETPIWRVAFMLDTLVLHASAIDFEQTHHGRKTGNFVSYIKRSTALGGVTGAEAGGNRRAEENERAPC